MRKSSFLSLVFVVLAGASLAVNAAPSVNTELSSVKSAQVASPEKIGKVKLNTVDAQTLTRDLFGIGSAKAKAIITYRETNGPFTSIDELLEVKGVGKVLLEKNRDKLEIN